MSNFKGSPVIEYYRRKALRLGQEGIEEYGEFAPLTDKDEPEPYSDEDRTAMYGYIPAPDWARVTPDEAVKLLLEAAQFATWNSWDEAVKRLERKYGVVLMRPQGWAPPKENK